MRFRENQGCVFARIRLHVVQIAIIPNLAAGVAVLLQVSDPDADFKGLDTPETAESMACDGIDRERIKVFVLDKEVTFQ